LSPKKHTYIFGPVPSRRLGRSLGVDLIPYKVCSYDCIYCQIGRTSEKTLTRQEYLPADGVLDELRDAFSRGVNADYVTLSGSGEPTLNSAAGRVIREIKTITSTPVAVLTNGSTLWMPEVREDLAAADLVVPSLDAGDPGMFEQVNRPHVDVSFEVMFEGLREFCAGFSGRVWLEVFILGGMTSAKEEAARIARLTDDLKVERIQLNTVARPPAESYALAVPERDMTGLCSLFGPRAEVIADFSRVHETQEFTVRRDDVLATLDRRPCTLIDITAALGIHPQEAVKHLDELMKRQDVQTRTTAGKLYYVSRKHASDSDDTKKG
jgi:wyosine [tRNA(Phe)-imidazoG37] synthetase (radical SAM superfamily)